MELECVALWVDIDEYLSVCIFVSGCIKEELHSSRLRTCKSWVISQTNYFGLDDILRMRSRWWQLIEC